MFQAGGVQAAEPARTYRPVADNVACSVIAGLAIAGCLYSLAVHFSWVLIVSILLLGALLSTQLVRRLVVDDRTITSHSLLSRRVIPWSAITSVDVQLEPPRSRDEPPLYSLSIGSSAGPPVRIRHSRWSRRYLTGLQAELNAQLRERGSRRA